MVTTGAMLVGERRCGWLRCWLEAAALRAGISYLFAASLTILAFRVLGNRWGRRAVVVDCGERNVHLRSSRNAAFVASLEANYYKNIAAPLGAGHAWPHALMVKPTRAFFDLAKAFLTQLRSEWHKKLKDTGEGT